MERNHMLTPEMAQDAPPSYELAVDSSLSASANLGVPQQAPPRSLSPSSERLVQPMERIQPMRTTSSNRLQKPIAIPATSKKLGSPFLRAYPPALEAFSLPKDVFLHYIDDLNRIAVGNPPLQVVGLAGQVVSMVPLHTAQIVGSSVQAASTVGVVALSKGRTEMFLRKVNKEVFGPRGLKVEIAKLDALAKLARMPILNEENKIDKKAAVLQPIENFEDSGQQPMSGQDRRLRALEPWIAQLELTPLPDIAEQQNPLSKLSVMASERQRKKEEKKLVKDRNKAYEDYDKDSAKALKDYEKDMRSLQKDERKALEEDKASKREKELAKVQKEREKIERKYEKEMGKVHKDRVKDDKEEEAVRKILWLIIRNLDDIDGAGPNPYLDGSTSDDGEPEPNAHAGGY